ncbi:hypothetical protein [Coralloluteibacterium thermophilus]|uniref:Uncharacterized protein n=1 Tax=Coralloluteibacterium thermophilum TaxID=2707049 RepID=A0ABV9NIN0_9GAMM
MRLLTVTDTPLVLDTTPFLSGSNAIAVNLSDSAVTIEAADSAADDFTTFLEVEAGSLVEIANLPPRIQLAGAGPLYLIADMD